MYIAQVSGERLQDHWSSGVFFGLHPFKPFSISKKVQVGKDQEKAQSEKDSHSKNRGGKKPN